VSDLADSAERRLAISTSSGFREWELESYSLK